MRVLISISMRHHAQAEQLKKQLEDIGIEVMDLPELGDGTKTRTHYIEAHLEKLHKTDVLLVANFDDERSNGYVGPSCFFEIGWAYGLGKDVYILNKLNDESPFTEDILAIGAKVLDGDINLLKQGGNDD